MNAIETTPIPSVNGVPLHDGSACPPPDELRQRACTELLRQAAQRAGLLPVGDVPATDGAISAEAVAAIERLLEQELALPEPEDAACRRHFDAQKSRYAPGEQLQLRHILFAVTPGIDVNALRARAEALLVALRCADPAGNEFASAAAQWSNCPTGSEGGELGWVTRDACAPEFAREVFGGEAGGARIGVLPRLVHSRFGFHVVEVRARASGPAVTYESVRPAVANDLRQQAWTTALRKYLQDLVAGAELRQFDFNAEGSVGER